MVVRLVALTAATKVVLTAAQSAAWSVVHLVAPRGGQKDETRAASTVFAWVASKDAHWAEWTADS